MNVPVVAIDGSAGSGKSTLGRSLATALGLPYVNTGLMYRAVAAAAARGAVDTDDGEALATLAARLRFTLVAGRPPELEVDGWTVGELSTLEVDRTVSAVSRHQAVRAVPRAAQRALGAAGAVMEGRDIGTVVFPDAAVKLYLSASPEERVRRRADERAAGEADARASVVDRDRADAATTPDEPAPDASVIDTSSASPDEVLRSALDEVAERAPELLP